MNELPFSDLFQEATQQRDVAPANEGIPLIDAVDHQTLQHRDAHFSGSFPAMFEYYENEGKGSHPEIDLDRIAYLWEMEKEMEQNLSGLCLTLEEQERVVEAVGAYKGLKELPEGTHSALLADLILSEEEYPSTAIAAIVAHGNAMTPLLIDLLSSETMHDPLFPGYGLAPIAAAQALGALRDPKAIRPLFEALGKYGFEMEEVCLGALYRIGEPARDFLIKILTARPLTPDNERAALALAAFQEDPIAREACLKELSDPDTAHAKGLRNYLQIAVV